MTTPAAASFTRLASGEELHRIVVVEQLLEARSHVWIATADLKDMHVRQGRRYKPILDAFDAMAARGVSFRIVHSALPSRLFRRTLEGYPRLTGGSLELQVCPRSHWKLVVVDGRFAYCGSANFTGAGLGVKAANRRNLELGVVSNDPAFVREIESRFDRFWIGGHCEECHLRVICPDPVR
jgi:phosphatidylserine/phosphatidylglycerophosphate/cardiolipin synthase-like enzyme